MHESSLCGGSLGYGHGISRHNSGALPSENRSRGCWLRAAIENRAKVYVRTQASSLRSIIDLMTLGGKLSDPSILSAVATLRHLWRLFFDEPDENVSIRSLRPGHFGSGFSVYFEMALNRSTPSTKAYIPIRHYCHDDAVIARAMAQYYREVGLPSVGDRYVSDIQNLWRVFLRLVSECPDSDARFAVHTGTFLLALVFRHISDARQGKAAPRYQSTSVPSRSRPNGNWRE